MPGVLLIAITVLLVLVFGAVDASHYRSLSAILSPDPVAAAGTLGLVGGAEGVTISIVIVVVVFGIQMTATRYSPRIIGLFTRNFWNALVLGFSLASILYTFLVRSEVKPDYVPYWSLTAAEVLALVNFAILLPYVGYIFEVMRAETLVASIRRTAGREVGAAARGTNLHRHRAAMLISTTQITDIAFGAVQLGDMPVCLMTIDALRLFLTDEYLPLKKNFPDDWFRVGHTELPGASDQILAETNRARTWLEYTVMAGFVDIVGLTPAYRREAVHAIAQATRDIGTSAIEAGDHEVAELCLRFLNTYLRTALHKDSPSFASATMNEYRRLAIEALEWRPDLAVEAAIHLLHYGHAFDEAEMPAILGAAAEDVADLAISAVHRDSEVTRRLARLLVQDLAAMLPRARPIGLNGVFKAVVKLALWAMAEGHDEVAAILVTGIAQSPTEFVEAALHRMEALKSGLFWEVNERVIAFDWVEERLRHEIPQLRRALANPLAAEVQEEHPQVTGPVEGEDLVQPAKLARRR